MKSTYGTGTSDRVLQQHFSKRSISVKIRVLDTWQLNSNMQSQNKVSFTNYYILMIRVQIVVYLKAKLLELQEYIKFHLLEKIIL